MLSQKITKNTLMIYENPYMDETDFYLKDLELDLATFEKSHYNLINGNEKEGMELQNSNIVVELFNEIDPYFYSILDSAHKILELGRQESNNSQQILEEIKLIAFNERFFLEKMDQIVFQYDNESKSNILLIKRLEMVIFYLILAAILFVTLFVFIPASKTLRYAFVEINERNENINHLFYSMKGALFLVDKNGSIVSKNTNAKELMTIEDKALQDINIASAVKWFDINILDVITSVLSGEVFSNVELKIEDQMDKTIVFLVSAIKGRYNNKEVVLICAYDITAQKKAEEILKDLAIKDELTELYNRHFLESIIKAEIERAKRYDYPISAAVMDIDNFKKINDKWGHPVGDAILKETARILKENSRESDYLIRIGGEEFVILMPHTNLEGGYTVAEKLRKAIENNTHELVGNYTASFGVAERKSDESYYELYNRMDNALYKAKELGKNYVEKSASGNMLKKDTNLEWKEKWSCGEKTIDAQHKELITEIEKMIESSSKLEDKETMIYTLNRLIHQIEVHFAYEEKILTNIDYKGLGEHKKIHTSLLEKSYGLVEQSINGEIGIKDLLEFMLHDVIMGHLLKEDTKFFSAVSKEN